MIADYDIPIRFHLKPLACANRATRNIVDPAESFKSYEPRHRSLGHNAVRRPVGAVLAPPFVNR